MRARRWTKTIGLLACVAGLAGLVTQVAAAGSYGPAGVSLDHLSIAPCPSQTLTTPFARWADLGTYFLSPGGSFETSTGWTLAGSAKRVSGNEPWYVTSTADRQSLSLPSGSSATTVSICATILTPALRFFYRNTGSPSSTLRLDMTYSDAFGIARTKTLSRFTGNASWAVGLPVLFLQNVAPAAATNGSTWVTFRLTAEGTGGNWQVDDFYVDPRKY